MQKSKELWRCEGPRSSEDPNDRNLFWVGPGKPVAWVTRKAGDAIVAELSRHPFAREAATAYVERMRGELEHAAQWFEERAKDYRENAKRYIGSDVCQAQNFIRWSNDCANQAASCREALTPPSQPGSTVV